MSIFSSWREWMKGDSVLKIEPEVKKSKKEKLEETGHKVGDASEFVDANVIEKVNNATPEQLTEIKGVGPATAKKILNAGPFKSFDHLSETVKIKPTILERLQAWSHDTPISG